MEKLTTRSVPAEKPAVTIGKRKKIPKNLGNDAEATNGTDDVPFLILASQDEN